MLILGVRLASQPVKDIFKNPTTYLACLMKLLIFPLFAYGLVYFLPVSAGFKACVLILSGTPCAAVILSLGEMHHTGREPASQVLLVSAVLCFLTTPLLRLLLG